MKSTHLVYDASEWPNIAFFIVFLVMYLFGAHIIWRTNMCKRKLRLLAHHTRQTKVSQLNILISVQENVTGLEITMKNLLGALVSLRLLGILVHAIINFCAVSSTMTMKKCGNRLRKNLPNKWFTYRFLGLSTPSDHLLEVSAIAVLHDDVNLCFLFVNGSIDVFNDMGMLQVS